MSIMYELSKRKCLSNMTVADMKKALDELPEDATLTVCGVTQCYIHVDTEQNIVTVDTDDLGADYEVREF